MIYICICIRIHVYTCIYIMYSSTEEEKRPCHPWLFQFGKADDGTSCEKQLTLNGNKWEVYKGTRFYNGKHALVVKRWLNWVDEDASGLTFEELDLTQDADTSQSPVVMLQIVRRWFQAQGSASSTTWGRCAGRHVHARCSICQFQGMNPRRFILSVDDDADFRSPCQWIGNRDMWILLGSVFLFPHEKSQFLL